MQSGSTPAIAAVSPFDVDSVFLSRTVLSVRTALQQLAYDIPSPSQCGVLPPSRSRSASNPQDRRGGPERDVTTHERARSSSSSPPNPASEAAAARFQVRVTNSPSRPFLSGEKEEEREAQNATSAINTTAAPVASRYPQCPHDTVFAPSLPRRMLRQQLRRPREEVASPSSSLTVSAHSPAPSSASSSSSASQLRQRRKAAAARVVQCALREGGVPPELVTQSQNTSSAATERVHNSPSGASPSSSHRAPTRPTLPHLLVVPVDPQHVLISFRDLVFTRLDSAKATTGTTEVEVSEASCRVQPSVSPLASVQRVSTEARMAPPSRGMLVLRIHDEKRSDEKRPTQTVDPITAMDDPSKSPEGPSSPNAAAASSSSRVVTDLPFSYFSGYVRDYSLYQLPRVTRVLRNAWHDRLARGGVQGHWTTPEGAVTAEEVVERNAAQGKIVVEVADGGRVAEHQNTSVKVTSEHGEGSSRHRGGSSVSSRSSPSPDPVRELTPLYDAERAPVATRLNEKVGEDRPISPLSSGPTGKEEDDGKTNEKPQPAIGGGGDALSDTAHEKDAEEEEEDGVAAVVRGGSEAVVSEVHEEGPNVRARVAEAPAHFDGNAARTEEDANALDQVVAHPFVSATAVSVTGSGFGQVDETKEAVHPQRPQQPHLPTAVDDADAAMDVLLAAFTVSESHVSISATAPTAASPHAAAEGASARSDAAVTETCDPVVQEGEPVTRKAGTPSAVGEEPALCDRASKEGSSSVKSPSRPSSSVSSSSSSSSASTRLHGEEEGGGKNADAEAHVTTAAAEGKEGGSPAPSPTEVQEKRQPEEGNESGVMDGVEDVPAAAEGALPIGVNEGDRLTSARPLSSSSAAAAPAAVPFPPPHQQPCPPASHEEAHRSPAAALWEEEMDLEQVYSSRLPHRFLVSSAESHSIWAIEVAVPSMTVRVVPPVEFFTSAVDSAEGEGKEGEEEGRRSRQTEETAAVFSSEAPTRPGAASSASPLRVTTSSSPPRRSRSRSTSTALAETLPLPLLGGARGFVDGHFSVASFNSPTALCWRLEQDDDNDNDEENEKLAQAAMGFGRPQVATSAAHRRRPRHSCEVLFISDSGNHAIRYANFRNRVVRTVAGVDGVPGYRDGSCVSSALRCATAMAWCSSGLLFADGPNGVIRLISGIGRQQRASRGGGGGGGGRANLMKNGKHAAGDAEKEAADGKGAAGESQVTDPTEQCLSSAMTASGNVESGVTTVGNNVLRADEVAAAAPSSPDAHSSVTLLEELFSETSVADPSASASVPATATRSCGAASHDKDGCAGQPLPSAVEGTPRVWTVAGTPPSHHASFNKTARDAPEAHGDATHSGNTAEGDAEKEDEEEGEEDALCYVDAAAPQRAHFAYPTDVVVVPDDNGSTSSNGAHILIADPMHHAVRVLDADGVRTFVGPLDYAVVVSTNTAADEAEEAGYNNHNHNRTKNTNEDGSARLNHAPPLTPAWCVQSQQLALPPGLVYPTQILPVALVTERAPPLFDEVRPPTQTAHDANSDDLAQWFAGADPTAAATAAPNSGRPTASRAVDVHVLTPQPYLHTSSLALFAVSPVTAAVSLMLPVPESFLKRLATASAASATAALAGPLSECGGNAEGWAAQLQLGVVTEGRRTLGEVGMPSIRRLVLPFTKDEEDDGDDDDSDDDAGEAHVQEGEQNRAMQRRTHRDHQPLHSAHSEADRALRGTEEQYVRLRFPWVLPPATPCTRHCIRSPYCYVSGRERGRRLQQQKQQPPLPLPRSASLPPLSSRPPLLPTVTPSQTAAAAVVGTAWLQDVPAYLVGRAGSSGRHAQSVSPPRQAQTYSYPTATHAIALSLVSESSPVPHPPSQCTEGRAPTTNVEEGSAHLGDLLVLSETPLEAAAEGSPVSRTGALSTANVAELKQEGEGAASTVSSAQPAHPLSASSTPKSPPPLPLSSAPPHRVLLAPPRSLSRPSDAQAADTSAVAESFSSSVASASAHSGDAGKAEAAGVAAQDDASAVEAEEPVVDTPVQLATDPINDEVMGTELGEVAAKEEAHAVGDHQPNVSDDAPPSRQTVSEQLPEAHTTAAAATTTTAAPSQTESLKPKEATEEKAGEKEASTEDAPTWQEVLVNDTDPVATAAATTTEVGKPSYDRQYRAMSADRKQLVLDTIRSDLNTAPKSPLSGSARRRSHSHSPTHAKSAERHLPGSCGGGGPPPLTPRTLSAHRLMQRRRPSTEAAASVTSTHARGSCCSVHGGSGPTARVAAVAAAVAQRPPAEMAEKKTTMNGEGRRTATSSRPPSLPLTPTASPRLDVQHMLEIAYDDAVAKLFTVYTFFAEARHETVTRITTVPAVAGANGKGATRGQVSKAGSRASTTRTIAGSGTSKQTEARTENAPGRSRLMVEQVTQYAVSLLSFWRFCVLTGYLAPITRLAILTRQRLQCRPSGADNTSDNDGERGAKAATSSSQRAPSHEAPLESPRRKGEAAPSPLLLPALSQTTVETEEIGGVPKQTPLYLPLSVCDERALVAVLHRCGLRTRGYHVLASMDFRSFRRVVLFLWMWEQQAATTLESVVTAAEAAEPHDRGSGAGLEKEKRSAPDVLRGPREGSDDDDDEAFGQQLKQRLFAQADTLPGLDSMSEEEVIAAYTEVFERAAERVPGLRVFATQRLGPLNVPAPSNGPLVRGGRGEGGGGTTSGQAVALTLSPIAANPIDRVASLPSSPRTPQAVVAGETAVTPAAAPSHPQSTPTLPRASSSAETPPCHVTPGLIAADELMLLLVTNEGTLRQLFDAYSRPQRVRRSAHYEPPTAAAAAAAVSNPVSFISESQLALPLQLYGEAASGGGRTSSYSRRGPSTTNTAAAASASVKGYRDHWSSINGSRDRGGRGGLTGRTASPAARRPPSAAAHPSQPPATARVRDSAVAASPFARRIAEQDVLWKVRQLLADGAEDNRVVFKATQDVVPAITYDGFQALFRTLDVFPSLLTQALLQRAFIDALRSPLLCSTPLSSSPSSASSFPPSGGSSREAPAGSASAHAALPEEEVQLLYSGKAHDIIAALPFLAFVEAFVRVALTAFSIAGDVDAEAFPTAVAKVAGLMRWVNQQVRLGLVQQRCHSSQVMPRRTVTRFEFPAKLKLFCTVAPTAADGPVLPRSQTQRKSPTASLAVGSAPPRTAPIRGTVK